MPSVNMGDLTENAAVGSDKRGPNDRGVAKWQRPALVAALVVMALIACAYALRGTLFWPMRVHRNVRFTNGGMSVESTIIPRVNGVYFEISNDSKERHQVVVLSEGVPYRTKGFIEEWQPFHRDAGRMVEAGQHQSYQGIYVYERPLTEGHRFLLFCNEPGHYGRGEYKELVVE
jgi:hypothetical protein